MIKILAKWLVSASAIILSTYIISGVKVDSFLTALWLSLFLGLVNTFLRPLLILLTLPITILTLGLFALIINALLILLAETAVKGFSVDGFFAALLFSVVLSVINYLLHELFGTKK